jgi:hypothetical protein
MSDPISTTTGPATSGTDSASSGPPQLSAFTRTVGQPTSTVGPRMAERAAEPAPQPQPAKEPLRSTAIAQAARREYAAREAEARANSAARTIYQQRREQYLSQFHPSQQAEARRQLEIRENQQGLRNHIAGAVNYAKADPEGHYELIGLLGQQHQVETVIVDYFQKTGRVLNFRVAADVVERWLERQLEAVSRSKKFAQVTSRASGSTRSAASRPYSAADFDNRPNDAQERERRARAAWDAVASRRNK